MGRTVRAARPRRPLPIVYGELREERIFLSWVLARWRCSRAGPTGLGIRPARRPYSRRDAPDGVRPRGPAAIAGVASQTRAPEATPGRRRRGQDERSAAAPLQASDIVAYRHDRGRRGTQPRARPGVVRVSEVDAMRREEPAPEDWRKRNHTPPQSMTAAELMEIEFEPTRWVVPDVLPEGLSLLVGKPKKGKSWMALGMCVPVSIGGVAFGVKHVEQGDTLYLALEDNMKRLRRRLKKILNGSTAPDNMHLYTEWPRLDEGGAEQLDEWLTEHPDARLVVIDTLAKIRNEARGQNIYAEDYSALEQLLPLAAKHGVAIVVVHHLRKMAASDPLDEISSSTGLTAGVDGFLILRRTPGSKGPTLYVDGRDIEEPTEYALIWNINTATWTIEGDAEEVHLSKERGDILLTLNRSADPMTPKEVADVMPGAKYNNVKYLMWSMLGDGQLLKDSKGRYSPANPTNRPTNPTDPRKTETYAEGEEWVSGVSGDSTEHGPMCLCEECLP